MNGMQLVKIIQYSDNGCCSSTALNGFESNITLFKSQAPHTPRSVKKAIHRVVFGQAWL